MSGTSIIAQIFVPLTDKWQSKTLFLAICDPGSSLAQSVFDCRLSGVIKEPILW